MSDEKEWWRGLLLPAYPMLLVLVFLREGLGKLVEVIKQVPAWLKSFVFGVYYFVFPSKLAEKLENERQLAQARRLNEKAGMLLEYEDLLKRKTKLTQKLKYAAERIKAFGEALEEASGWHEPYFHYRLESQWPDEILAGFQIQNIELFEQILAYAEDFRKTTHRLLIIEHKLSLFGIKRSHRYDT